MKVIINKKREESHEAARIKLPVIKQVLKISYRKIINDVRLIIKMKRTNKSVRINYYPQAKNGNYGHRLNIERLQSTPPLLASGISLVSLLIRSKSTGSPVSSILRTSAKALSYSFKEK